MIAKFVSIFTLISALVGTAPSECTASGRTCDDEQPSAGSVLLQSRKGSQKKERMNTDEGGDSIIVYSVESPLATNPQRGMVIMEHHMVGCFPRSEDDPKTLPSVYMDVACVDSQNRTSSIVCRSGLPFFRMKLEDEQSFLDCFSFCLSKGLDLFGVMAMKSYAECRCGATLANIEAWQNGVPRSELLLPSIGVEDNDKDCAMVVWQYTGGFENGAVPSHLMEITEAEQVYLDSIVKGEHLSEDVGQDFDPTANVTLPEELFQNGTVVARRTSTARLTQVGAAGQLAHKGLCVDSTETGYSLDNGDPVTCAHVLQLDWCQHMGSVCPVSCGVCSGGWSPCYPMSCAGMNIWQTKNSEGTVVVHYFFDDSTLSKLSNQELTKATFRLAADEYKAHTCIEVKEVERSSSNTMPRIMVGHYGRFTCWASTKGGDDYTSKINLGWCRDSKHKGNMMHEIMHLLGVNHEQMRSDAQSEITLPDGQKRGPYLEMHWNNIPKSWRPQYKPAEASYIGSGNQGPDDPFAGYAPYDYESIMHYSRGRGPSFSAVEPQFNSLIGQRTMFSDGDILQLNDMYQCKGTGTTPPATPSPPQTPAPTEAPDTPEPTPEPTPPPTPPPTTEPTPTPTPPPTATGSSPGSTEGKRVLLMPVWSGSPWSRCAPRSDGHPAWTGKCNSGCIRKRTVTCMNATTGAQLPESSCPESMRLAQVETCVCADAMCIDHCNPGFLSLDGVTLSCSDLAVKNWCDNESPDDPEVSAIVQKRCPETCGLCGAPRPSPSPPTGAPAGKCKSSCATNPVAWPTKCGWNKCGGCSDC